MARARIGTSGWIYKHWRGRFYPEDLPQRDWFAHYARSGIGKSALVQRFASELGLDCVSLLGSQLAPEDLIGVPQIVGSTSRFCPPSMIARTEPYCLFLDELNACTHEVQKAFYSLIHERRIGEYHLPEGSIVIGAGNRAQDGAIVKPMSSALLNRMVHVHLKASHRDWLAWAGTAGIHPLVVEYVQTRPDHLQRVNFRLVGTHQTVRGFLTALQPGRT